MTLTLPPADPQLNVTAAFCTYGGTCLAPAVMAFTREDAIGERHAYGCAEHRKPLADAMSRYVPGWGAVTFTATPLPEPATDPARLIPPTVNGYVV